MCDIENFLNESHDYNYDQYFDDIDFDDSYLDVVEFSENVLSYGCIQKKKKKIYDYCEND